MVHSVKVPEATTLGKPRLNLMCGSVSYTDPCSAAHNAVE